VKPSKRYTITTWPSINLEDSNYNGSHVTILYVHGWSQTGNDSRLDDLKDAILHNMDANVILVDWGTTAHIPYPQAVSNTRIVSAQILRLWKHLTKKKGADKLKLNRDDATFVEVIHTNGRPTLPLLGLGIYQRLGDVDFYFNGGWDQPGCTNDENLHLRVFCPHVRSLLYYVEALKNPDCKFWGIKRSQSRTILSILSGGWLSRYLVSLRKCKIDTCIPVGLDSIKYPARGAFDVATSNSVPYC
ncbi:hypothetical protein L9F63_011568, partial [Diploptera punctata]